MRVLGKTTIGLRENSTEMLEEFSITSVGLPASSQCHPVHSFHGVLDAAYHLSLPQPDRARMAHQYSYHTLLTSKRVAEPFALLQLANSLRTFERSVVNVEEFRGTRVEDLSS
jgi:hypothetical protein